MGQEILKDWQRKTLAFFAKELKFKDFYLSGGTALAVFYLQHRVSDDLDFFSENEIDSIYIHDAAKRLGEELKASETRFEKLFDRYQFFYSLNNDEVKVEFSQYPFKQFDRASVFDGIYVDSEYDIAVNKLAAILDRFDPKDFVDMYFLLPKYPLRKIADGVLKKFGISIEPIFLASELVKVRRIESLPKMLIPLTVSDLKSRFEEEAKKIGQDVMK